MRVLVLNGGSSSLKAAVYDVAASAEETEPAKPVWHGDANLDSGDPAMQVVEAAQRVGAIDAAGHRIVNGGRSFTGPQRITPEILAQLRQLGQESPQHNRLELAGIAAVEKTFGPRMPQVAVFDSAFHSTLPPEAYTYPGPSAWLEQGIRRFGFHGISHRYVSRRAAQLLGRPVESLRLVTCHLGNGSSLAAVDGGKSIDTTMGFTPLEGLMMGTRSGSVDPGILIHLMRSQGSSADDLDRLLNRESGFKGLAGSSDLRQVMAAIDRGEERARLAFDVFIHRLAAEMGAMLAALGGANAFVFTGGIGENVPQVRERACARFAFLGVLLDPAKNALRPDRDVAAAESKVRVLVIRTEEDWEIAREVRRVLLS
jgi:acetate kinase